MKMRYSLRTLLIVMFLVGPLCVFVWPKYVAWREVQELRALEARILKTRNMFDEMPGGVSSLNEVMSTADEEPSIHD